MQTLDEDFKTPGQLVEFLLFQKGWSNRVLAMVLDTEETGVSKIISNKKNVTPDIAILLEEVFGVPAERFISLQRDYDLAKARLVARPNPQRATRAQLFSDLPIAEMIKRGWLGATDIKDMAAVEQSIAKFFGAANVNQIEVLPHAAKKTVVSENTTPTQLAWLYRVKQIASEMIVGPCSNFGVRRAIELLRPLTSAAEEARKVPQILSACGIRFVLVESLLAAKIDGVCFWLNETAPVIGMSMRFDRIDNFWFVLRHELEHVIHEHGKSVIRIDASDDGDALSVDDEEQIADGAAADFCAPANSIDKFIARKAPTFAERDLLGLAATLKVHPGIVAGQLRRKTGRYELFGKHLVKIRAIVAPSAMVDGWGDVAQVNLQRS